MAQRRQRTVLAPEVLQVSAMDCGPAILSSVLAGYRLPSSYGRLRELCQTDVDGTAIETLEEVLTHLGLEAEQVMVPVEFLLEDAAALLPAVAVVTRPDGAFHFLLIWRRIGPFFQIMDPARGRRWVRREALLRELHVHAHVVPRQGWAQWANEEEFLGPTAARLRRLRIPTETIHELLSSSEEHTGIADPGINAAALDAALRVTESLVRTGAVAKGRAAAGVLGQLRRRAAEEWDAPASTLPNSAWSVRPLDGSPDAVELRGCVLVRVRGPERSRDAIPDAATTDADTINADTTNADTEPPQRPLLERLRERPEPSPERQLFALLRQHGRSPLGAIFGSLGLGALAVAFEALLFTSLIGLGNQLPSPRDRALLLAIVVLLLATFLGVHWLNLAALLRLGRHLEANLRQAFLRKLPRLSTSFFNSRLHSDMAERGHNAYALRELPRVIGSGVTAASELVFTVVALAWIYPGIAGPAVLCGVAVILLPMLFQPFLAERDLRLRTLSGTLSRYFLDSFLGLVPLRAHGAEKVFQRQHDTLLGQWVNAGLRLQRTALWAGWLQSAISTGLAAAVVVLHIRDQGAAGLLLLAYWALRLPSLGAEVASAFDRYPMYRSLAGRLMEPLGAPNEADAEPKSNTLPDSEHDLEHDLEQDLEHAPPSPASVRLELRGVSLEVAGHLLLRNVDLVVGAGEHVALLGASGAGKSTLLGLLLGWHRPSQGEILVDDHPLTAASLHSLRQRTAWIDPAVQLWNRSLAANLRYGVTSTGAAPDRLLQEAELYDLVERLPQGLITPLGEGGSLISGGEGQRVRYGRGAGRRHAALVLLDEAFRGLDEATRGRLLTNARHRFRKATLLAALHSPKQAGTFDRIVILESGRVVECGSPQELLAQPNSAYRRALEAEGELHRTGWRAAGWRHWTLSEGRLTARHDPTSTADAPEAESPS